MNRQTPAVQTTFYDTTRFKNLAQAEKAKEVFRLRIFGTKQMIITDPDGIEIPITLQIAFTNKLSMIDERVLRQFLGDKMSDREEAAKANKQEEAEVVKAGKRKPGPPRPGPKPIKAIN